MLGWEFPPFFAGGVGIVCYELTRGFSEIGQEVTFIMPKGPKEVKNDHAKVIVADNYNAINIPQLKIKHIDSLLTAYTDISTYDKMYAGYKRFIENKSDNASSEKLYGKNLMEEIFRFALKVRAMNDELDYEVIHAHDWTTFPAAIELKKLTGKPMFVHVHITEFDKSGGAGVNQDIYNVEREGMHMADKVIVVSHMIKNRVITDYGVDPSKIEVVHNGGTFIPCIEGYKKAPIAQNEKIVLFCGRVTLQKGPEYFIEAARRVCQVMNNVKFVVAGTGDMLPQIIDLVAQMGLANKFVFTGFYTRDQAIKLFNMADVFVMPSVSEPFGIVPLEAISAKTPAIISKQSGVAEAISHCLKVDFWDTEKMASHIISILRYKELHHTLSDHGYTEVRSMTWDKPARKCIDIFSKHTR